MRIRPIIFGSDGFIGTYMREKYPFGYFFDTKRQYDILNLDYDWMQQRVEDANCLIHLAADPDMAQCEETPIKTIRNNYCTTVIATELSNKLRIPMIFTSTSMVYKQSRYLDEVAIEPNGPVYTKSKLLAEKYILDNCRVPFSIIRLANCVGSKSKHGVIWDLCSKEIYSPTVCVRGNGKQLRSYVHATDFVKFCDVLIKMLQSGKPEKENLQIINFGNADLVPVSYIVSQVGKNTGKMFVYDNINRIFDPKEVSMRCSNMKLFFPKFKYMSSREAINRAVKGTKQVIKNER